MQMNRPKLPARFSYRKFTFGIFDTFPKDAGRQAYLSGKVAAALLAVA
jgi:hypothetical protein